MCETKCIEVTWMIIGSNHVEVSGFLTGDDVNFQLPYGRKAWGSEIISFKAS